MDVRMVYEDYAARGTDDATRMGWNDEATQTRYMGLMLGLLDREVDLTGKTVHDAGCGYGALLPRLHARSIGGYIGTDLVPESVQKAKDAFPGADFRVLDLLQGPIPAVDVTICMGALAFHRADDAMRLVERLWAHSKVALAFNSWWGLTPRYVGYWETRKLEKRLKTWFRRKTVLELSGYDATERMFVVRKPVVEKPA